jgi:uncharacterized membrane protein
MAFAESIIAIAGFLSVSAVVVFVMLVIGIRKGDRARHLSDGQDTALDALTRRFLGGGIHRSPHDES